MNLLKEALKAGRRIAMDDDQHRAMDFMKDLPDKDNNPLWLGMPRSAPGPIGTEYVQHLKVFSEPLHRDGIGVSTVSMYQSQLIFEHFYQQETHFMNISEVLKGHYDDAVALWKRYDEATTQFRSKAKNDVSSLEAAARKTTEAVQKMNKAYGDVVTQLTSADMVQAVSNAERLAAAMTALANLQSHKLVFAVSDQSKPTDAGTST